jgi:hypothetical protein
VLGFALSSFVVASSAMAQAIWFSPNPRLGNKADDYMDLFQPDAPWQQAASHVQMFEISGHLIMTAPEADLRRMFADLKRRHIGLEIGIEPLTSPGPRGPTNWRSIGLICGGPSGGSRI